MNVQNELHKLIEELDGNDAKQELHVLVNEMDEQSAGKTLRRMRDSRRRKWNFTV